MTEQIIIDGVDVSGCEKQGETIAGITCGNGERIRFANEIITKHKLCKDNPNCVYKQLKAKEQECEELKEELHQIKKEIAFGNNGTLSDKIRAEVFKELNNENDQLKAQLLDQEAETLKAGGIIYALKQTLIEIKEIAEREVKHAPDGETFARPEIKQILQKISECEV